MSETSKLARELARLARLQRGIGTERWELYKEQYRPVEEALVSEMRTPPPEGYYSNKAVAAIDIGAAPASAMVTPFIQQGVVPTSGLAPTVISGEMLKRAMAEAGARNATRGAMNTLRWERLGDIVSMGKQVPTSASRFLAGAAEGYASAARGYNDIYRRGLEANLGTLSALQRMRQADIARQYSKRLESMRRKAAMWGALGSMAGLGAGFGMMKMGTGTGEGGPQASG